MKPKKIVIVGADWPELEKYCPNWQGMKAGLDRLAIPYLFISCRPTLNVEQILAFEPDLVVYALRDMISHKDWRDQIRAGLPDAKIVMWYGDLRNELTGQWEADCREMDAMFVSNNAQEKFYKTGWRMKNVYYLPLGCEPMAEPIFNKKYEFDFVFIGGQISEGAFQKRSKEIDKFKLDGGLTVINSFEPDIRARIFQAMPVIYSSAKIALDVSHFTNIEGYTSIRFFEIPAMFGFALTKRFPGCEQLYPAGARVYFDTFEEAMELKNYYLVNEKERRDIIKKAHKHSYQHTYDKRFLKMFELLNL